MLLPCHIGCICTAGPKHTFVSVLPHQEAVLVWRLVAYSSGHLDLPNIELVSQQHSLQLSVCHARKVHILPAKLPQQMHVIPGPLFPMDNLAYSVTQLAVSQ